MFSWWNKKFEVKRKLFSRTPKAVVESDQVIEKPIMNLAVADYYSMSRVEQPVVEQSVNNYRASLIKIAEGAEARIKAKKEKNTRLIIPYLLECVNEEAKAGKFECYIFHLPKACPVIFYDIDMDICIEILKNEYGLDAESDISSLTIERYIKIIWKKT